ncbi:hypothetical protein HDU85_004864 [Gaertneriomyces sp. JEL0708]|nr:hypothetical protein HDU85_004864 [Gaertneriomyces sp. JEL0708]
MELPWCAPDQEVPEKFPWRPHKDFISHILHRVKSAFREAYLLSLPYPTPPDSSLPNPSALEMFHQERPKFARLAGACARMSSVPEVLYDNKGMEDWGIQFSELDQWKEVWKAMVGENSTSPVRAATTTE